MKTCSRCKEPKSLKEFHRHSIYGTQSYCKPCDNKKKNEFNAKNPEKRFRVKRRNWLKDKYGITPEEHKGLLEAQGFKCAICKSDNPRRKSNWLVDHCHKTGRIRGLLCHHCNLALGHVGDSTAILTAMIQYIEQNKNIA